MYQSPRIRRLHNDLAALERLRSESSVFRFTTKGDPPQYYLITFKGQSLAREHGKVHARDLHRVEIKLGASYPRTIPELRWMTPIYHPNISEIGLVCLGGYGTHWVPSIQLDELCSMLWDMARYHNYDVRSPYNREAALWVANQTNFQFPMDSRPVRDLRAALGRIDPAEESTARPESLATPGSNGSARVAETEPSTAVERMRQFVARYGRGRAGRVFSSAESNPPRPTEFVAPAQERVPRNRGGPSTTANERRSEDPVAASMDSASQASAGLDDLVILDETHVVEPPVDLRRPTGDEILFIE